MIRVAEEVSAFYPSGAIWKADGVWYSEDEEYSSGRFYGSTNVLTSSRPVYNENGHRAAREDGKELDYSLSWASSKYGRNSAYVDNHYSWYEILPYSVRNIYFDSKGLPASYDCYKTIQGITLIDLVEESTEKYPYAGENAGLQEYGIMPPKGYNEPIRFELFFETDDDGNYIPNDTRHEITLKKTQTGV